MVKINKILNVKLPFIEAVEYLHENNDIIGCACCKDDKMIIMTNSNGTLNIFEHNEGEFDNLFPNVCLSVANVLNDNWFVII